MCRVRLPGVLPKELQPELKKYPFPVLSMHAQPIIGPPMTQREKIVNGLHLRQRIFQDDIWHVQMQPEESKWTKDNAEAKFCARFETYSAFVLDAEFETVPDE